MKTRKGWIIERPDGLWFMNTAPHRTRKLCIDHCLEGISGNRTWSKLSESGYRCIKVEIREIGKEEE